MVMLNFKKGHLNKTLSQHEPSKLIAINFLMNCVEIGSKSAKYVIEFRPLR